MKDVQIDGTRAVVLEALAGEQRWYTVAAVQAGTGLDERPVRLAIAWLVARQLAVPRYGDQGVHDRALYTCSTLGEGRLANINQLTLEAA